MLQAEAKVLALLPVPGVGRARAPGTNELPRETGGLEKVGPPRSVMIRLRNPSLPGQAAPICRRPTAESKPKPGICKSASRKHFPRGIGRNLMHGAFTSNHGGSEVENKRGTPNSVHLHGTLFIEHTGIVGDFKRTLLVP